MIKIVKNDLVNNPNIFEQHGMSRVYFKSDDQNYTFFVDLDDDGEVKMKGTNSTRNVYRTEKNENVFTITNRVKSGEMIIEVTE